MTFDLNQILIYNFLGNSVKGYLLALGVFVLAIIILKIFKNVVIKKIKKLADHTKTDFDDLLIKIVESIGWPFYFFSVLYLSFQFIHLPEIINKIAFYAFFIVIAYYVVKGIQKLIDYGVSEVNQKIAEKEGGGLDSSVIALLSKIIKGILWGLAIIIILQNLGYNVTTLAAGLGIGGLAIAFALQNILGDIFSSFSIYFDKPFRPGDFIIVGKDMGIVKHIGIKSTRIQALEGQEIVLSNRELTTTRVNNYGKMEKRRIVFRFGVVYETLTDKLKKIPDIIREIADRDELVEVDRVHFTEFGDFSLNFEVVYYIKSSEYLRYRDIQQEMNFAIKEKFEQEGIEMAYPTQTLYINKQKQINTDSYAD